MIPSLIYIETGKMISEQGREGYFVGSLFYFGLFYILTLLFIYLTFNSLNKIKLRTFYFKYDGKSIEMKLLLWVTVFVLTLLYINLFLSPSPLLTDEVTRFTYWQHAKFPVLNKIFGNTSMFIPFAAGILFTRYKKTGSVILILYFIYNFFIGQKFSPILMGTFAFLLPQVLLSDEKFFFRKMINFKTILIGLVLVGVMYKIIYDRYERRYPFAIIKIYDPNEAIFYRIFGLQAHLFWGATERFVHKGKEKSWDLGYLPYGMRVMMEEFSIMTKEQMEHAKNIGFNYTNGYPAILFMIFPPPIAYLFHILVIIFILSLSGWILMKLITNRSYILALISFQFFIWTVHALTMGYFYKSVFGIVFNIFILALGAWLEKKDIYAPSPKTA
jgi:hypothetical protein